MTVNWRAAMISPDDGFGGAPRLRTEFAIDQERGDVVAAVLHATARGVFTASINGAAVSDEVLSPGWSSYEWRLRYRSYDVAALVRAAAGGPAVLGLELGNGWFGGRLGWGGRRALYGPELAALAQLEIRYTDGSTQTIVTDGSWRAGPSPVLANDLYDGETIDARRADDSWQRPGFGGDGWVGVHVQEFDTTTLTPYLGPVVRRQEEIRPVRVWTSSAGATLVDFGRTSSAGSVPRCAARRVRRSPCGTRKSSRTASSAPGRCAAPWPPTGSCSPAATTCSSRR